MNPKTSNAKLLLLGWRYKLRPPNPNPNCANSMRLYPPPYPNFKLSSHNLTSSSNFYDHCTHTGLLLRRSLPINSPHKAQIFPFFITSTWSFCRTPVVQLSPGRPEELSEIVEEISRGADDMESNLEKFNFTFSPTTVAEILRALNDRRLSAARFFDWILNHHPTFKPNSETYNLLVNNLGRLDDYTSMRNVLSELSSKGHCLTEKAFAFLNLCSSSTIKDSVRKSTAVLNAIRGSCRASGIHSLIKLLCAMDSLELASLVMAETIRNTSYYNLLIAARCRKGEFRESMNTLDEMRRHGCDPNTKSYNHLLGSLFKSGGVVEACELLQAMENGGCVPDSITYELVAAHACKANRLDCATEIVDLMLSEGVKPRPATHAAFIKGFFRCGRAENAYNYVIEMSVKDECSKNSNYSLLADLFRLSGRAVEAGGVLREMMVKGLKPNFPVYVKVMKELHAIGRGDLASELKSMFLKFNSKIDALGGL